MRRRRRWSVLVAAVALVAAACGSQVDRSVFKADGASAGGAAGATGPGDVTAAQSDAGPTTAGAGPAAGSTATAAGGTQKAVAGASGTATNQANGASDVGVTDRTI